MEESSRIKIQKKALLLILALTVGMYSVGIVVSETPEQPTIYVSPSRYTATHLSENFDIAINIKDVTSDIKLVGVEWKIRYNATLLQVISVTEGDFMKHFAELSGAEYPYTLFMWNEDKGVIGIMILPLPDGTWPGPFPDGSGTLATVNFAATYRPTEAQPEPSCVLEITDTTLLDVDGVEVPHESENGYYEISARPGITVTPDLSKATHIGEFNVTIDIENLDRDWMLIGAEFKLHYNITLLETAEDWIFEGPFLQQFAPHDTMFIKHVEDDYGVVGIFILPNATGGWSPPFPEGSGTLATITFNATYLPWEPEPSCVLQLDDTDLIDVNGTAIPHTVSHGYYEVGPYLALVPDTGFAATTVVGGRFAANSQITLTWNGEHITTVPSPLTTDSYGNFTAIITVLNPTDPGLYSVTSTDQEGNEASAMFTVIDMTGPQGEEGEEGEEGEQGIQGPTGPEGEEGEQGIQGPTGPEGEEGEQGAPAPTEVVWASIIIAIIAIVIAAYTLLTKKT